jgi:hypothetical protein
MQNRIICPDCKQRTLPTIGPDSTATAAACQNTSCRKVYERARIVELQTIKEEPEK